MADSAFWKNLGDKFRLIFDVPNGMRAKWTCNGGSSDVVWEVTGEATSESRIQFFTLAKIAGKALDPSCQDGFQAWMLKLRERGPNSEFNKLTWDRDDGTSGFTEMAYIVGVIPISASLCDEFELQAQLAEQRDQLARERRRQFYEMIEQKSGLNTPARSAPIPELIEPNLSIDRKATVGEQIERFREECRMSVEQLAEEVDIEARSVYRHLSGKVEPRLNHLGAYDRVFSKHLGRKIVIERTSGKRQ